MGWLTDDAWAEYRAAALRLTEEERKALTLEAGRKMVPPDTLAMASYSGWAIDRAYHPWEALCFALGIDPNTPAANVIPLRQLDEMTDEEIAILVEAQAVRNDPVHPDVPAP